MYKIKLITVVLVILFQLPLLSTSSTEARRSCCRVAPHTWLSIVEQHMVQAVDAGTRILQQTRPCCLKAGMIGWFLLVARHDARGFRRRGSGVRQVCRAPNGYRYYEKNCTRTPTFHATRTSPEQFLATALHLRPTPQTLQFLPTVRRSTPHSKFGYFSVPCDAPYYLCYCPLILHYFLL